MFNPTHKFHTHCRASLLAAAALFALGGTAALAADSLAVIPTLAGDTVNTALGITPDGKYIVGISGGTAETLTTRGYLYEFGAASAVNLNAGNAQATVANGVGYRTSGTTKEVIISGKSVPTGYAYGVLTEYMLPDGGVLASTRRRSATWTANTMGAANQLGSRTGSDAYYVAGTMTAANSPIYVGRGAGTWVATMTWHEKGLSAPESYAVMNGLSASGRAVGWRGAGTAASRNYMVTYSTSAGAYFNGLAGDNWGQAFAVSADGNTVFGQSPVVAGNVGPRYGYKTTFSGAAENGTVQGAVTALPLFGDEAGSTSLQVPYGCTVDGNFAVGMAYRGQEKAVLWSTKDDWSFAIDLTQYAADHSLLEGWSILTRAYSVGETFDLNGQLYAVVTGLGVFEGANRAFVMTVMVPEPGTISLLALGGLVLLAHRRRK